MELLVALGVVTTLAIMFVKDLNNLNIPNKQSGTGDSFLLFDKTTEKPHPEPKRQPLYSERDVQKN
jgi:hypothetical protein